MHTPRPKLIALGLLGFALAACDHVSADTSGGPSGNGSARATASHTATPTPTASSAAPAAALSPDADPIVTAELKKFESCSIKAGFGFDFGCAADEPEGFKAFASKYVGGNSGQDAAKVQKLGKACLAVIGDADAKVRIAAADCLKSGFDVRVDATALDSLFTALEAEKVAEARTRLAWAIGKLALSGKNATRAVALIDKLKPAKEDRTIVASLLEGLKRGEPNDAAIDAAISLAGDDDRATAGYALELLEHLKTRTPDACKAVEAVVVEKKTRWAGAASTLVRIDPACKPDYDKLVAAIAEKLEEEDKDGELDRGSKILEVAQFVDKAKLSAGQKAKLSKAVTARTAKKLAGEEKELETLKKNLAK